MYHSPFGLPMRRGKRMRRTRPPLLVIVLVEAMKQPSNDRLAGVVPKGRKHAAQSHTGFSHADAAVLVRVQLAEEL